MSSNFSAMDELVAGYQQQETCAVQASIEGGKFPETYPRHEFRQAVFSGGWP